MAGVKGCSSPSVSLMFLIVVTIAIIGNNGGVAAQSSSPSPGCLNSLVNLTPCLGYVANNITTTTPSQGCCTALSSVVKTNASCLCLLFTINSPAGFPINQTRAMSLPGACQVTIPTASQCKAAGAPAPSTSAVAPGAGVPAPSASAVPSNSAPKGSAPSSSAASPTLPAVPSARSPTSSVGGISPTASVKPNSSGGNHLTSSTIMSALVGVVIVSYIW